MKNSLEQMKKRDSEEKRSAKALLVIRRRERRAHMFRNRLSGRTEREKRQEVQQRAATQAKLGAFLVMVAYLKEYLVLTKATLHLPTFRTFLLAREEISTELGLPFIESLRIFATLVHCDPKHVKARFVDYFLTYLQCQERWTGKESLTNIVVLERALVRTGFDNTQLCKYCLDFNLKMSGDAGGADAMAESKAFYDLQEQRKGRQKKIAEVELEDPEIGAAREAAAAEELRLDMEAEAEEMQGMVDAERETHAYYKAHEVWIKRQIAARQLLADQIVGAAERMDMRVEDKRSKAEEERYREWLKQQHGAAMSRWRAERRQSEERRLAHEQLEEKARQRREKRLAAGVAVALEPCTRQVEEQAWILRTENEAERSVRQKGIHHASASAAATAVYAAMDVLANLHQAIRAVIAAREKQVFDTRIALSKAQQEAMNDPEVLKVRQEAEKQLMMKEEMQILFFLRTEQAIARKSEKVVKEAAKAAALRAQEVSQAAVQTVRPTVDVALLWVAEANDVQIEAVALAEEEERMQANKSKDQIRQEIEEANALRKKKRKADAKRREVEVAAKEHARWVKATNEQRFELWAGKVVFGLGKRLREGGTRSIVEAEALEDLEGEAGLLADMRQAKRWVAFQAEAGRGGGSHRQLLFPLPEEAVRKGNPPKAQAHSRRYWQMKLDSEEVPGSAGGMVGQRQKERKKEKTAPMKGHAGGGMAAEGEEVAEVAPEVSDGRSSYARDVYAELGGRYTIPLGPTITPIKMNRGSQAPGQVSDSARKGRDGRGGPERDFQSS
jgi:hypothetical protein